MDAAAERRIAAMYKPDPVRERMSTPRPPDPKNRRNLALYGAHNRAGPTREQLAAEVQQAVSSVLRRHGLHSHPAAAQFLDNIGRELRGR